MLINSVNLISSNSSHANSGSIEKAKLITLWLRLFVTSYFFLVWNSVSISLGRELNKYGRSQKYGGLQCTAAEKSRRQKAGQSSKKSFSGDNNTKIFLTVNQKSRKLTWTMISDFPSPNTVP